MGDAFAMLASDWQTRLENPAGLRQTFEGIPVNAVTFGFELGDCYTNTTIVRSERRPTNNSVRYSLSECTARVNNKEVKISARFVCEGGETKILGMNLGDDSYGQEIAEDCVSTAD